MLDPHTLEVVARWERMWRDVCDRGGFPEAAREHSAIANDIEHHLSRQREREDRVMHKKLGDVIGRMYNATREDVP